MRELRNEKVEQLTPVIPVVVYHGKEAAPRMLFRDLFDLAGDYASNTLSKYIPAFEAALVDVSHMPEWQLDKLSPALSAGLWSFRIARGTVDEFLEVVNRIGKRWGKVLLQDPGFELLLTYMLQGSGLSPGEFEEKVNRAIEDSLVGEAVVTTYDQLIEKGENRRAMSVAEKLLSEGMSVEKVAELTELPIEKVREIAEKRSAE